jgi:hypothetical protein
MTDPDEFSGPTGYPLSDSGRTDRRRVTFG